MKRFYLFLFLLLASLVFSSPVLAADSTSFDPTKVMVQSVGASLPVGTVITWPSNSWPSDRDNWLECNGQSISSAVYPELAALVGATVPDYRGYFLRGVGGNSASLGEKQGDAIKHPTTESVLHFWKSFENCWATGVFSIPNQSEYDVTIKKSNSGHSFPRKLRFDLANAWESGYTAVETRPVNRAVRYLIRAR